MTRSPDLTCVSLFSGCGGLDHGIQKAGFRLVLAADNDPACAESHRANFRGVPFFEDSVANLTGKAALRLIENRAPKGIDLLVGGPPCPPFSKSRFYRVEKPRALKDPLALDTIRAYLRILRALKPKSFLLENVPGLAYKVHSDALKLVVETAEKLGYKCEWRVLNAADFGLPQIRERLFLVGIVGESFTWPSSSHAEPAKLPLAGSRVRPWVTAGQAIGDLDTEENASDIGHFAGGRFHEQLVEVPPGDNYLYFTAKRGHPTPVFDWRSRYWSFLLKLSPDLPSWTIQARRSNNMGPFHWRNRILRIEEVKRLQGIPDGWYLAGSIEQQWRQVGNAAPPIMGTKIGRAIARSLRQLDGSRYANVV